MIGRIIKEQIQQPLMETARTAPIATLLAICFLAVMGVGGYQITSMLKHFEMLNGENSRTTAATQVAVSIVAERLLSLEKATDDVQKSVQTISIRCCND